MNTNANTTNTTNATEILSYKFLNPKFLQSKRDGLALTTKTSARYSEIQAEVSDLEARAESEKPLRAERDRLLAALKAKGVIPSKFGPGYVQKSVCGWVPVDLRVALLD